MLVVIFNIFMVTFFVHCYSRTLNIVKKLSHIFNKPYNGGYTGNFQPKEKLEMLDLCSYIKMSNPTDEYRKLSSSRNSRL